MAEETSLLHNGCGGELKRITREPVPTGTGNPPIVYDVFRCEKCGKYITKGHLKGGEK